jgi:hypothetical protein
MSRKKIYTIDAKDITVIISGWKQIKPIAEKYVKVIETANHELMEYINNRTPLTDPIYGHLSDFRRMNYMMSPYISKLPDYLKQIKSGITPAPVSEEVIEQLSMIVLEATEWKEAYKKVVAKYKTIHTAYKLTFYSSDGNLDFANWLK